MEMLTIRAQQLDAFQKLRRERFIENAVNHLLEHYPDPCKSSLGERNEVQTFVTRGIDKASLLNVNTPGAVTALLELWLQFGEKFERSPIRTWTMNMLSNPDIPCEAKVDVIRDRHLELTGGCVMVVY
jgi:hypothetical protein